MNIPSSLPSQCPDCDKESFCRVVKGRAHGKGVLKAVVKCGNCGKVFDTEVRVPKPVKVRTIISHLEESKKTVIELPEDWEVRIKDEVMIGETCVQVTGIEIKDAGHSKRADTALPGDISTLWTRYFNEIVLKVSINKGRKTESLDLLVGPEEVFEVGEVIVAGKIPLKIYKIKIEDKVLHKATAKAKAKDIVRIYGKKAKPD